MAPKSVIVFPSPEMYWITEHVTPFVTSVVEIPVGTPRGVVILGDDGQKHFIFNDEFVPDNGFFRRLYGV